MNNNIKKWVQPLRSGEYVQGHGSLRTLASSYCCLGVACDLHARETGNEWVGIRYLGEKSLLPTEVIEWLGLSNRCAGFDTDDLITDLASKNDSGSTFSQIANIIESEPKGLFNESER